MNTLLIPLPFILLGLLVLALVVILWRTSRPRSGRTSPYTKRPSLLTPAELRFYRTLFQAVPSGLIICPKVRLMDVVTVPDDKWQEYGAQGSGMHLDFDLAVAETAEPMLVIEQDDRSHWRNDAQKRDAFKDAALASADVPRLRVLAAAGYDVWALSSKIGGAV